ncbi:MAG: alpha/beta fold hydrolase [Candidatus Saccharimonadales bacterium]
MTKRTKAKRTPWYVLVGVCICFLALVMALAMIVPVWVALAAGISGVSILVFSFSILVALSLFFADKKLLIRLLAALTLVVSLFSIVVPQAAYLDTARSAGAKLTFNPITYLTFSGSTDIKPTSIKTYKTVGNQKLEMSYYKPENAGVSPVVILLHGGAWRYGSHLEMGQWPRTLTNAGYGVVSVEYRLSNDTYHSWKDTPADVHDAITYLKANASLFSIDPEQMHLLGQSAGGHLALLEAYRFESVRSVTALYAPIDLTLDYETSRDKSAELDFIGGPPKQYRERYESLSPITYVDRDAPSTLVIQGLYDDLVHHSQATQLQNSLDALNIQNEVVLLPLTGHSFENQRGGFATQIATQRILQFLK